MPKRSDNVYTRKDRPGYWIDYRDASGKRRRKKVQAGTRGQARKIVAGEQTKAETARALGYTPPTKESFSVVTEQYLKHQKARVSPANYERECGIVEKHFKPFFSGDVSQIRRGDIHRYMSKRIEAEASNGTIIKELNVLKHIFGLCVDLWEYIPANPCRGVKPPKAAAGRVRYLQPTELKAILEASPAWLRPIIALGVSTGMRRSEILKLRWLDIDLKGMRAMLPQTKNGEGRVVYLNQLALAAISSLPKSKPAEKLFPKLDPHWVSVAFMRVCRELEIFDFRFHDLRHTAASWLRMGGADIHTVAQLLGHKDLRMAARYQHLSPAYLSQAVNQLDQTFADCHPFVTTAKHLNA